MRQTITKTKLVTGPNVINNKNNDLESLGDSGTMCVVEEVVLDDVIWDVEVVLDDVIWNAEVALDDVIWNAEVVLDDVDDSSLQSLATTNRFSFANRQSKFGLFRISMNCKLGKVVRSSVAFIEII